MVGVVIVGFWIWVFEKHFRIDKSKSFSNQNGVHINGIESFWSFTKRRLAKFNGVKSTFILHLKECEWRWRKEPKEMEKELWELLKKYGYFLTTSSKSYPHFFTLQQQNSLYN